MAPASNLAGAIDVWTDSVRRHESATGRVLVEGGPAPGPGRGDQRRPVHRPRRTLQAFRGYGDYRLFRGDQLVVIDTQNGNSLSYQSFIADHGTYQNLSSFWTS